MKALEAYLFNFDLICVSPITDDFVVYSATKIGTFVYKSVLVLWVAAARFVVLHPGL